MRKSCCFTGKMNPSTVFRREMLLVLTALRLVTAIGYIPRLCPQYCRCDGRTKNVSCVETMFTKVPLGLPHDTRTLELQGNNFTRLGLIAPSPLRSLRRLNLVRDNVYSMTEDALSNVPKVKRLDLSFNHLSTIPVAVSGMTLLKELIVHRNRIRSLHASDFANMTQLQILDLSNNSISYLPVGVFSHLQELEILYLSNNSINSISGAIFGNLSKLEELHLTSNSIQVVSAGWLSSMPNTWVLELGYALARGHPAATENLLTTGNEDHLLNVERLVLSGNHIVDIPCEHFAKFPSLKYLDLSLNSIQGIPRACFSVLGRLEDLKLGNNAITALEYGAFFDSYSILRLDLSGNLIKELPPGVFIGTSPETLDLGFNEIRRLNNESFIGLEYLSLLFLRGNRLDRLPRSVLRPLQFLYILDLRWNHLTRVSNQFCNMSTLTNLGLSGNKIEHISQGAFRGSTDLMGIFLDDNRLKTVAEETFDLPNLVHVTLNNNPWHCDCRIRWMREAMFPDSTRHQWMLYTDAYQEIMCVSPLSFANVSVFLIKETEIFRLICTTYASPLVIEFIVGISFAIIASSTLCYVAKLYCKVRELERTGAETGKRLS